MLSNKHILIGISGGIAAYKIPELIRSLVKTGADLVGALSNDGYGLIYVAYRFS